VNRSAAGALALVLPFAFAGGALGAQSLQSRYTSLQGCAAVRHLVLRERTIESGALRCPGVDGFSVYVVDDDPRGFLVLERAKKRFSFQGPMVNAFLLGDFPNVSGAAKAEWRLDSKGRAVGLIVRVSYMRGNAPASALFCLALRGTEPALIGVAKTNEEARALIERTQAAR